MAFWSLIKDFNKAKSYRKAKYLLKLRNLYIFLGLKGIKDNNENCSNYLNDAIKIIKIVFF